MPDPISSTVASRIRRPDSDAGPPAVERGGRARRLWSLLPVCAAFAVFGVVVWLAYEDASLGPPIGEPPLIRAAPDPIKLPPEQAEDTTLAAEQGTVGRLWSDAEQADQPERLLPLPEQPRSPPVAEEPAGQPARAAAGDAPATGAAGEDADSDVGVAAVPSEAPADVAGSASLPSPPDESLQEAEAALDRLLAEVTALSEDTDSSGAPAAAPVGDQARADRPAERQESPASEPAPATAAAPTSDRAAPAAPAETAASEEPTPAPRPEVRPAGAITGAPASDAEPADGPTETAALTGTQAPISVPTVVADGDFRIQLAAVREEADARRAWELFMVDLRPVLGSVEPIFERAETTNGVFYRVQIGPFASQQTAESLCEDLKQHNASCFVIRR